MGVLTQTLEQQLDALIAKHGLTAVTLTRIARKDGTSFWAVYAQQDGLCGTLSGSGDVPAHEGIAAAIENLNEKRARPVIVPELASLEQAA